MKAQTLYVTDLDGTLLDERGQLPAEAANLLRPLADAGVSLTVCTARSWVSARPIIEALGIRLPVILHNGVFVRDMATGEMLRTCLLNPERAGELADLFEQTGVPPLVYTIDDAAECHVYYPGFTNYAQRRFIEDRLAKRDPRFRLEGREGSWRSEQPYYVNAIGERERLAPVARVLTEHADLAVIFSEDIYAPGWWWLEAVDRQANKGAGVRFVRERIGAARVVCFGDQLNDLPMFHEADLAVAVSNAHPGARKAADRVIGAAGDNAVARFIHSSISHI